MKVTWDDGYLPSQRFIEKGDGHQVNVRKLEVPHAVADDPARAAFIDALLARRRAKAEATV
jgi:hypothetical protein